MIARTLAGASLAALLATACTGGPPAAPTSGPTDAPAATVDPVAGTPTTGAGATPTALQATPTLPAPPPPDDGYGGYGTPGPATPTPAPATGSAEITLADQGYLLGPANLALYTFDNDSPGSSSCDGSCAQSWPPLIIDDTETPTAGDGIDGELGVIERADGTLQVTYDDAPLYYYAGDSDPSDTNGDGLGGVWHLARP
jgi:predicted lipoprotein with Yx(FWY)xxD motif